MYKKSLFITLILTILIVQGKGLAQVDSIFSSPYSTIYNHLYYLQSESYKPAQSAQSFDLNLDKKKAINLAIKLKQVLDGEGLFVQMNKIPENSDFVDSMYNKNQYYLFPEDLPEVFVELKDNRWQYGEETILAIPGLHKKTYPFGTDYLINLIPGKSESSFLGLSTWQYLGILIIIFLAFVVFFLFRLMLRPLLKKIGKMSFHIDLENEKLLRSTSHVLSLLLTFILVKMFFPVLQLPVKWTLFSRRALEIIITVFIALLLLRVLDFVINYFKSVAEKTESKMDDQLIPIISQIMKLVIIIVACFQILHLLNVNVAALIAGISIGGLALALAAKDTVNNLIGSLMIFLDKPFQIGDFIDVKGDSGTVIEVGFRTTRLQTKDTSIISIPNGTIANTTLTNKGMRVYRLFEMTLGVTYDTPADLIEVFVDGLRKLSFLHPEVKNEDQYIHMSGFGDSAINIFFRVYLDIQSFTEEMKVKEEISLSILRMADELGVRFAFPSTTLYIEDLPGQKTLVPEYGNKSEFNQKLEQFFELNKK